MNKIDEIFDELIKEAKEESSWTAESALRCAKKELLSQFDFFGKWISVKDRLPEKYEPFYAACKSLVDDRENWTIEGIYMCNVYGGPWGVPMIEMGKAEVYAWMPKEFPEPPMEEE